MAESQQISTLSEIWSKLTLIQRRYVVARLDTTTKSAAAEAVDIDRSTAYQWPDYVSRAVELASQDATSAAMQELSGQLLRAASTITSELQKDGSTSKSQRAAAVEVMDRVMGKPTQRQEIDMDASVEQTHDLSAELEALSEAGSLKETSGNE